MLLALVEVPGRDAAQPIAAQVRDRARPPCTVGIVVGAVGEAVQEVQHRVLGEVLGLVGIGEKADGEPEDLRVLPGVPGGDGVFVPG